MLGSWGDMVVEAADDSEDALVGLGACLWTADEADAPVDEEERRRLPTTALLTGGLSAQALLCPKCPATGKPKRHRDMISAGGSCNDATRLFQGTF